MVTPRAPHRLRSVTIKPFASRAPGSVLIEQGRTRVLCTASLETELPGWLRPRDGSPATTGWVTAEYAMLPGSTPGRKKRGPDSRGTEIQRLISRSLRAGVDLRKMPGVMVTCDCDVLNADGGTRTASITGAFVALTQALAWARAQGLIAQDPILTPIAAVSVGLVAGRVCLDLDYELDKEAQVDMNVVMDGRGRFVEVQGTAERMAFTKPQLDQMLALAQTGIKKLIKVQRSASPSRRG